MRGQVHPRHVEAVIGGLAAAQHGVVARRQLLRRGVSDDQISRRLTCGYLHPVHRGVYAVGHPLLPANGRFTAAVLAGRDDAVLSHTSAAQLWDLPAPGSRIHVTAPRHLRSRSDLIFHRGVIPSDERTVLDGIPVTTVARTLLDLAAVLPPFRVEKVVSEAEYRRLTDSPSLPGLMARYPGRRGVRCLRTILGDERLGVSITHSELEDLFRAFLAQRGLPAPEINVWLEVGGVWIEVDCLWRQQRLIMELDGRSAHDRSSAFESDRLRDRRLTLAGWRPLRVTSRQLQDGADALDADLRRLLLGL